MNEAYLKLEQLRRQKYIKKHGKEPSRYFDSEFKVKTPKTAAQLEALISEYIEIQGGICTKVTTSGRRLVSKHEVKDVTGKERTLIEDKWIPGTTEPGTSDLIASVPGIKGAVYIEVKFSSSDKMRESQVKFQQKVISRGFTYIVIRSFEQILEVI